MKYNWFSIASGQKEPLKGLFQQTLLPNITLVLVLISRMNNHCLQQQSVNSARTENILNLTIRTWWLRSRSVKTFSKSICLARQLKYYLPSLVTISISQILGDTWPAFTRVFPKRAQGKSLGTRLLKDLILWIEIWHTGYPHIWKLSRAPDTDTIIQASTN